MAVIQICDITASERYDRADNTASYYLGIQQCGSDIQSDKRRPGRKDDDTQRIDRKPGVDHKQLWIWFGNFSSQLLYSGDRCNYLYEGIRFWERK